MTIFPNKKSFPIVLFFWVFLLFLLIANLQGSERMFPSRRIGDIIVITLALALVLFYLLRAAINYLYAMFSPNARLTIDDGGLDDQLTIYSLGRIYWSEVDSISSNQFLKIDLLLLKLKNPASIINQQQKWKRRYLRKLLKKWGTPMIISQRLIDYDIHQLRTDIQSHLTR
jgi:hypothetical protein